MYIPLLYLIIICFLGAVVIKANKHKAEWLLLLIILSYVKTCIMYLFEATTVFTVFTIGGTQVHLDDIVLIVALMYCIGSVFHPVRLGKYFGASLLLLIPVVISLVRGILNGTVGSEVFLSDTRKYVLFIAAFLAFFFLTRQEKTLNRLWKYEHYIDVLMNIVCIYVLIVWSLDLLLGMNSLPGQQNGLLSDGGSTFRIINPPQVLMIAFYTLYRIYKELEEKKEISLRTMLLIGIVVLMQWRTVVAAFGVGLVITLCVSLKRNGLSKKVLAELFVIIIAILVISSQGSSETGVVGMVTNLFESFSNVGKDTGTFATRTEVWTMILGSLNGVNMIFGRPFGQDLALTWKASAHSGYIDYIAKMGYFGLGLLIVFLIFMLIRTIKTKNYTSMIILCSMAVYWYGYGFTVEQGALLGFIVAFQEVIDKQKAVGEEYDEYNNIYI
ncbi:MAG: O-antigen ligase family protein [Blautia sp.]